MLDALDAVESIEDPVARARAVSRLLKEQRTRNAKLKQDRDQTVRNLRAEKVSLRGIAQRVGVSLGTVQDILRGHSGTWSRRPKSDEASPDSVDPE